jgi:hypothetical protein
MTSAGSNSPKLAVNSMEIYGVRLTIPPVRLGAFFAGVRGYQQAKQSRSASDKAVKRSSGW